MPLLDLRSLLEGGVVVTPAKVSLTLTTFAPIVSTPRVVVPTKASLVLSTFAPAVTLSAKLKVTPAAATLVLTGFAPVVTLGAAKGGGMRARTLVWIPADTGRRWVLRTMEPEEMVAIAAALHLSLPQFITLHAAAEDGDLIAA